MYTHTYRCTGTEKTTTAPATQPGTGRVINSTACTYRTDKTSVQTATASLQPVWTEGLR